MHWANVQRRFRLSQVGNLHWENNELYCAALRFLTTYGRVFTPTLVFPYVADIHKQARLRTLARAPQGTDCYVLRMAEEDWDPDLDFPGLDSSAVITNVGVDQFVLCKQVSGCWLHESHCALKRASEDGTRH